MWDSWWTKWHQGRLFSEYIYLPCQSFHKFSVLIQTYHRHWAVQQTWDSKLSWHWLPVVTLFQTRNPAKLKLRTSLGTLQSVHKVRGQIKNIRDKIFYTETTNSVEVTTLATSPDATYQRSGRQLDSVVTWSTVQSCLSLRRIVKWMCWRSNVFASSSARNLVRQPQKRTKCYNKHSEKQRRVGPRHLNGIPDLKMAARPSTMMIAFFDAEGLVHHEFLPQRQTMNQTVYITVLQHLRDAVRRKRPHKWSSGTWLLYHDNAPCALSVREFLAKHSIPMVPQPPYSPDLAPCDFFLFPRLKSTLKGKRFQDVAEIQLNTTRQLQTSLPDMKWKVEGSLESLHIIWRVVLWRR
jgi:histone-lysine N-methyltransferase SETMAR